jgi:Domain of unknown function (DUF4436)
MARVAPLCAAGVGLYIDQRDTGEKTYFAGSRKAANRVDLDVTVQQVDATNGDLVLSILATPQGALARQDGTPTKNLVVAVIPSLTGELRFPAGRQIAVQSVRSSLVGTGTLTDYPFDRYTVSLGFGSTAGGHDVPSYVSLREVDPFFVIKMRSTISVEGWWWTLSASPALAAR